MYVYCVDPIDWWAGWQKPADFFVPPSDEAADGGLHTTDMWERRWTLAQQMALDQGWEGDIRDGPYVTVLPNIPGDYSAGWFIIAWKQDNNGTTFIASPVSLPYLRDHAY